MTCGFARQGSLLAQHVQVMAGTALAAVALLAQSQTARAQYLVPTAITTTIPTGSNNGTRNGATAATAYVDDVYLSTISFGALTFSAAGAGAYGSHGQFATVSRAAVVANPGSINAEFGDLDNGSDGDATPFVKAGIIAEGTTLPGATRESTTPEIQNAAIAAAFNGLSLVEGIDGEENGAGTDYTFDLVFKQGIAADGNTATPELLFFERGRNSRYSVQVITGKDGTGNFTFSSQLVTVDSSKTLQALATGIFIDTIEIPSGQELGATGLSLNSFGLGEGQIAYGVRLSSLGNTGADLYGAFLSASDTSQFRVGLEATAAAPEPGSIALLLTAGVPVVGIVRRRRSAKSAKKH